MSVQALVRVALRLDAVVSGATGAAYLAAAGPLDSALGMPAAFLRGMGVFMLAYAAAIWWLSSRRVVPRRAVMAVVAGNLVWAFGSLAFLALDVHTPSTAGSVWIVLQALVVAGFAALQAYALRRA
jgi:hypothetical protein